MHPSSLLRCCALLLVALCSAQAQAVAAPDFAPLAAGITRFKAATGLPTGTAVAVVKDGEIIYTGYFGQADLAAGTPVDAGTVFYIASATKPFFALNALLQARNGQLETTISLRQMFPEAAFAGFDAQAVTLQDLLTHASGVDNPALVWATAYSGVHDRQSLRALVAASQADAKAAHGTFKYSNVGYNIASVWMDERFGTPWQGHLEAQVFRPLGMRHTSARISTAQAGGWTLARPYSFAAALPREPLYLAKTDATMHAAGGMVASAPDLARFLIAELATGQGTPLPTEVVARSQQVQVSLSAQYLDLVRDGYAWGWYVGPYKGQRMLHHLGGFAGFHAYLSFMPEQGIGLVVLNNEDVLSAQLTRLIADYVYGVLLGEADVQPRIGQRFASLQAKASQITVAIAQQRQALAARPSTLSLPRASYAGSYSHPRLGEMSVEVDRQGAMSIHWGRLASIATAGISPDQVRVEFAPNDGQFVDFTVRDGQVAAIGFDGLMFARQREAR